MSTVAPLHAPVHFTSLHAQTHIKITCHEEQFPMPTRTLKDGGDSFEVSVRKAAISVSARVFERDLQVCGGRLESELRHVSCDTYRCGISLTEYPKLTVASSGIPGIVAFHAAQSARIVAPAWQLQTMSCNCQSDSSKKRLASP